MKIQLIKEVNGIGETWYHVTKDGSFVTGTITRDFEEAVANYNKVVATEPSREIIMEQEIDY